MTELHGPWLVASLLTALLGSAWVSRQRDSDTARQWCLVYSGATLLFALVAWLDFLRLTSGVSQITAVSDPWDVGTQLIGRPLLVIDSLSALLLPLVAALYMLTAIATPRTKIRRFSFSATLVSETILLATLSTREPWAIIALLAAGTIPPFLELRARDRSVTVYTLHMGLFIGLLVFGWSMTHPVIDQEPQTLWAVIPLMVAVCLRSGIVPLHCWMTDLFEHATFGTALLFVTPLVGAYAALRLVLPISPDWVLHSVGLISLFTAFYAAGMALVQREARRFFCYLFLSHSALLFVGLDTATPIGLTGALCTWLSVGMALSGFGLTLRALEARLGRVSLTNYHGVYEHTPALAICSMLTGLASVGFPGTFGFVGTEILVDGAVQAYPFVGMAVVIVAALNGIAVVKTYFLLFTGTRHASSVWLGITLRERFAVLTLAAAIITGGLFPQVFVMSRHNAAIELLKQYEAFHPVPGAPEHAGFQWWPGDVAATKADRR